MPGPAFTTGERVSLHPIEDEDYEFIQRGRNHPSTRIPLTDTEIRTVDDVAETVEDKDKHFLICVDERSESTGDASGAGRPASGVADGRETTGSTSGEGRPASGVADGRETTGSTSGEGRPASSPDSDDDDPEPVGAIGFTWTSEPPKSGDLMYWIAPEHRQQGYVTEAAGRFFDYAFGECGFHKVTAHTLVTNEGSIGALESLGFEREGHFREEQFVDGECVDAYRYGLLADEWLND
jgi:ribosomal protein S18 acetylase RimI-like enzyme